MPDFDRVQKLAERIVTGTEKHAAYRAFVLVKGLAEYRAGRQAEAVKWLERYGPHAEGAQEDASAFAARAMAQHRLGQKEKALARRSIRAGDLRRKDARAGRGPSIRRHVAGLVALPDPAPRGRIAPERETSRRSQVGNEAKCSNQCGDS